MIRITGLLGGLLGLMVFSSAALAVSPPSLPFTDVQVGRHPLGVAVYSNISPGQALAVVANRNSSNISVVDLLNLSKLSEFEVGRYPTGVAINAATGIAVVTLGVEHAVAVVDPVHAA